MLPAPGIFNGDAVRPVVAGERSVYYRERAAGELCFLSPAKPIEQPGHAFMARAAPAPLAEQDHIGASGARLRICSTAFFTLAWLRF